MKACRWNLINFSNFTDALIRKEKSTHTAVSEKRKTEKKNGICFIAGCFKIMIFFFFARSFAGQFSLFVIRMTGARNIKMGNWERQIARHCKLQYLFQK